MTGVMPPGPLSYQGVTTLNFVKYAFSPTSSDYAFLIGTVWVNTAAGIAFILLSKASGTALWGRIAVGISQVDTLTGDTGGAIDPDANGNFNIKGGANGGIVFAGNESQSALDVSVTNPSFTNSVTTSSSSPTALITIPVSTGVAIALKGYLIGSNAVHTDITGGDFLVVADGTAAAIIGSTVANVQATSTGTFSASFSAGSLNINVTAPSSAIYNWKTYYSYVDQI